MAAFILVILVIGVFNFVLGYGLALAFAEPSFLGLLRGDLLQKLSRGITAGWRRTQNSEPPENNDGHSQVPEAISPPTVATVSELPEPWQQALQDDDLKLNTLALGATHYLRLEGAIYREHLLTAEGRARHALAMQDASLMEQLAADLRFINVDWTRKLRQAGDLLRECTGRLGPSEDLALCLARRLRDLGAQIADIDSEVQALNFRNEGATDCRRMLAELQQLIHLAHLLRDHLQGLIAGICHQEGNLSQLDRKLHYDTTTGLLGRMGVEVLFNESAATARPVAAMRISLDRFDKVNQRLGARAGDHAIKAAALYLAELSAEKCPKSILARQAGSELLLLANEATVEELTAVGEHLRQSFEAAGFSYQGSDFSLTLTISIVVVAADDALLDVLNRLDVVQKTALKSGRNRSARWENGAAILSFPPAIPVTAKVIQVETTAA